MSDDSTSAFSALKESSETASSSSATTADFSAVKKPVINLESPTSDATRFSAAWFLFHLSHSYMQIIVLLSLFFFSLVITAYALPKEKSSTAYNTFCSDYGGIIPDITVRCPVQMLQVTYGYNAKVSMGEPLAAALVTQPPVAVFLPHASPNFYYTVVILDPDSPSARSNGNKNHILGIATNLRLSESPDITAGEWLLPYEAPSPSAGTGNHRYVFLAFRHTNRFTGEAPVTRNKFIVDDWLAKDWAVTPTLMGANWFISNNPA